MSRIGPTASIEDSIHALDAGHTMQFIALEDDDLRGRSYEEEIADRLMGRRDYPAGTVGIHKKKYSTHIMTSRGWARVIRGEDGKHYLAE